MPILYQAQNIQPGILVYNNYLQFWENYYKYFILKY